MNSLIKKGALPGIAAIFIAFIFISGCQLAKPDPSEVMKPIVDKYVDAWNTGNLEELDSIVDSAFVRTANSQPEVNGLDGIKKVITGLRMEYPDLKITVDNLIYSEDGWAGRWVLTGRNTGPGENPPTGKTVSIWGESIAHVANGKMTREMVAFDNQSLMEQLGFTMMPPSEMKK